MSTLRGFLLPALGALLMFTVPPSLAEVGESDGQPVRGDGMLIDLWRMGKPAFGEYVTQSKESEGAKPAGYTRETGTELASNVLLDFAFLSLEQHYDRESAEAVLEGIRNGSGNTGLSLLVRIPPISEDGVGAARTRVKELLAMGADGVVVPHILSLEEARTAVSFFDGVDVWSPQNPDGTVVAMLIVEDPDVFAELEAIADLPGYSSLVCGIGSLTSALNGDRAAAELINLKVLAQSKRAGLIDMITVDPASVERRVEQGFVGLLAYGPESDRTIRIGRSALHRANSE